MAKQVKKPVGIEFYPGEAKQNGTGDTERPASAVAAGNGSGKNHYAESSPKNLNHLPSAESPINGDLDHTILVGRDKELAALNEVFATMLGGTGSVLFVTGEAGLGKTTLVHEWWKNVAIEALTGSQPPPIYAESACSTPLGNKGSEEQGAFQPWAEIVQQIQKIVGAAKTAQKIDLKKIIYESAPAWAWALPVVGGIAHAAVETSRIIKKQKEALDINLNAGDRQQVYQQYVNLLSKIAEEHPLVIMLDDVHWADRASVNLLFYLSRQIAAKRILVVATYRPEDATLSIGGDRHPVLTVKNEMIRYGLGKDLPLRHLGEAAIRQLLAEMFSDYKTDRRFERWLRKISDGNALFVTQYIKTLREDGHIDSHGAFNGKYEHISVPPSALAVVEERMQRLAPETRRLLGYAAVEGEEFTSAVLAKLAKKNPAQLLDELQKVQRLGIIIVKERTRGLANKSMTVFGFSHSLLRTALYDKLLDEEKALLHRECYKILSAEWERLKALGRVAPGFAAKLMSHAEECREWATASDTAIAAARGVWQTFSEEDAEELLANARRFAALDTSPGAAERQRRMRAETALLESEIALHYSRYADALAASTEAYHIFEQLGDPQKTIAALICRTETFHVQGMYEKAEQEAHNALLIAEQDTGAMEQVGLLTILGKIRCSQGLYDDALAYHNRCMEICESSGDRMGIALSLSNIGTVHRAIGAYDEALANYKRSLEICESVNNRRYIGALLLNIGEVHTSRGEYEEALTYLRRSLHISETIGDRPAAAYSLDTIGGVYNALGSYGVAQSYHEQSLRMHEAIGDRAGIADSLHNIGLVYDKLGSYNKALEMFNRSLKIRESIGDRAGVAASLHHLGLVYGALDSYDDALDYLGRSLDIRKTIGDRAGIAASLMNIGSVYTANGGYNNALIYFTRALEIQSGINDRLGIAATLCNMGILYRFKGDFAESRAALERANALASAAKSKELWGSTLCELGLLCKAEAKKGNAGAAAEHDAVDYLERGIRILHDISRDIAGKYLTALEEVKNRAA